MTKAERVEMYRTFLVDGGYAPEVHEGYLVIFTHKDKTLVITVDDDEEFFRLAMPNFWSIESEAERRDVIRAAERATRDTKAAKVFTVEDDTWASIEMFCWPPETFKPVFERSLTALNTSVDQFVMFMRQ